MKFGNQENGWWDGVAICIVVLMAFALFTPRLYASDEMKYFVTLRSIYFDHDLHYENEYAYFINRDPVAHAGMRPYMQEPTPTGYRLNEAPIGTSLLWAPLYIVADGAVLVARAFGATVPRDGYSWPYVLAICLSSLAWGMMGLFLTYRLCRMYASNRACTLGLLGVCFASPLVFYLYITPAMSHANSLFSVALFLFLWHIGRDDRQILGWVGLGFSAGLMILVRELNWLFLLVPVLDSAMTAWVTIHDKTRPVRMSSLVAVARYFGDRWRSYVYFCTALVFVIAPQFYVYWILNGTLGPTHSVVEKFSLVPKYAFDVLFSGFHGLFSWHPITLIGVVGLGVLWPRDRKLVGLLMLVFVLQVLVVGAYSTWWGGASFGARRFINCIPIFALGLVVVVDSLRGRAFHFACAVLAFLVMWNFGLAVQYSVGLIPRDAPVSMRQIVRNQIIEVPSLLGEIAWRFMFNRSSFYRTRS
jgi:hypothetical protein